MDLWPATCTNIVVLLAKKFCVPACRRKPVVQNYAHETPHASVENGCVFSAARRGFRAVGQSEFLAEHLGLSPATVSLVINRSPAAKSIPHRTQERIRAAARELNYRPKLYGALVAATAKFYYRCRGA